MLPVIDGNPVAIAAAGFGALCLISWPFFPNRRLMLLVQLGIGLGFGAHYALIGAGTAAVANWLSALQVALSLRLPATGCWRWVPASLLIAAMLVAGLLTFAGPSSMCAMAGTVILAIGRMQSDELRLRIWVMAGTIPWLVHDLLVASPIAVVDAVGIATALFGIWRSRRAIPACHS